MIRRLFAALACFGFASTASASPDLAAEWGYAAGTLYVETVHAIEGGDLPQHYEDALIRFSVNANRLGNWIEKTGGPSDLGCIFRGMSAEAETQLYAITSDAERSEVLTRLAVLFYDAESVALAAIHASADTQNQSQAGAPTVCTSSPAQTLQYLTEQP